MAPLIGTPISVLMFGGLTGGGTDIMVAWLLASGQRIFTAAFIPRVAGNLIDKVASCLLVVMMLKFVPKELFTTRAVKHE